MGRISVNVFLRKWSKHVRKAWDLPQCNIQNNQKRPIHQGIEYRLGPYLKKRWDRHSLLLLLLGDLGGIFELSGLYTTLERNSWIKSFVLTNAPGRSRYKHAKNGPPVKQDTTVVVGIKMMQRGPTSSWQKSGTEYWIPMQTYGNVFDFPSDKNDSGTHAISRTDFVRNIHISVL